MKRGQRTEVLLTQLTGAGQGLYGLDKDGRVWKFHPADYQREPKRYAYWSKLTSYGVDATGPRTSTSTADDVETVDGRGRDGRDGRDGRNGRDGRDGGSQHGNT